MNTSRNRRLARTHLGIRNQQVPVHFLPESDQAPKVASGRKGGHFTRGGTRIEHPGAYGRKGWSNMVYITDDRTITVGEGWEGLS